MKRILCVIMVFLCVVLLVACSAGNGTVQIQQGNDSVSDFESGNSTPPKIDSILLPKAENDNPTLPPVRISENTAHALLERYTLERAYTEADLICVVQIGDWLGEDVENYSTFFEAQVVRSFKGDANETITLKQSGCSELTFVGYPLFTYGNNLFLFLKESDDPAYGKIYWILGSYSTVFDVAETSPGETYVVARTSRIAQEFSDAKNYKNESTVCTRLQDALEGQDSVVYGERPSLPYIFSVEDVQVQIKSLE